MKYAFYRYLIFMFAFNYKNLNWFSISKQ